MLTTPKSKGGLFLASSLCDGLEDNDIKQVTTLLLNNEADPNILIPSHGVTPFHLVIGNDSVAFAEEVTKLFLRHGGDPNVKSVDGLTPVHVAAAWGRATVLEYLLANGGDPFCLDNEGRSPFHYAFDGKYYDAVEILGKYCDQDVDENKETPYTMVFDKLLINNGDVMAEYVAKNDLDAHGDTLKSKTRNSSLGGIASNSSELSFSSSGDQCKLELNSAAAHVWEVIEREKCLVNEIINQLSSSLQVHSKNESLNEGEAINQNTPDLNTSFGLSTDENMPSDAKDKFCLKPRLRKRSVTPRYKRRMLTQNHKVNRSPLTTAYCSNDAVLSKSPNCNVICSTEKETKCFTPHRTYRKADCNKPSTPCMTEYKMFPFDEFHAGKKLAHSSPRQRTKLFGSHRKFRKNRRLAFGDRTSPDSAESLSPDRDRPYRKFNNNVAIKLDENGYDDDDNVTEPESDIVKIEQFNASRSRSQSYISVQEEYKYDDPERGVALLERRIYPLSSRKFMNDKIPTGGIKSLPRSLNVPMDSCISNKDIRKRLLDLGYEAGPVTNTTRQLYLKRLSSLEGEHTNTLSGSRNHSPRRVHRSDTFLDYGNWVQQLQRYRIYEKQMFEEFSVPDPTRKWREGTQKVFFNYLLLDPRITRDLSCRASSLSESEIWTTFLSGIFYIGKGKRSRPFSHLYDAFEAWVGKDCRPRPSAGKIKRIQSIWGDGYGVISLCVFQNTIPAEAYTREAAMIEALGKEQLENCVGGSYYGILSTWSLTEKRKFGRYLLHKALQILLQEGERQILPQNL